MSKIDIPMKADIIVMYLWVAGYDAYVVGGCVRDSLLGKEPHDWDICTDASPEQVRSVMNKWKLETIDTGIKHGTITVVNDGDTFEVTTFRVDGEYSDNRRPDTVEFVDDITEDLSRRDFTINAMAYNDKDGLVDPFNGQEDLKSKLICCVGHPDDRFREDALRILRALRFASTYDFKIEAQTAYSIHKNKSLLKNISAERIREELCKMLCGEGVLDILLEYSDVMATIIPELEPCIGFNQNNPYHKYTVYDHIAHAVSNYVAKDISIKMALLLHDIGKPLCYVENNTGGHFPAHSITSKVLASEIMDRLKFDNKTKTEVLELVLYHDADIQPKYNVVRRWLNKIGHSMLQKLVIVRLADIGAQKHGPAATFDNRIRNQTDILEVAKHVIAEQQCFQLKDLAVNGRDILALGVDPGPRVGEVLSWLLAQVMDEKIANEYNALIKEANRYLKGE